MKDPDYFRLSLKPFEDCLEFETSGHRTLFFSLLTKKPFIFDMMLKVNQVECNGFQDFFIPSPNVGEGGNLLVFCELKAFEFLE